MTTRSISAASVARLLGEWRGAARSDAGFRLLARSLRLLIVDGRVGLGVRLPGERELAQSLGISRTTVTAAYGQLRDEGYLLSRRGSGSITLMSREHGTVPVVPEAHDSATIDMIAAAMPAPSGMWSAYEEALRRLPERLAGLGYDPFGLPCLRAAIARDYEERGCPTRPEQILGKHAAWAAGSGP